MTNLPTELGVGIFKQILNTPKPDYAKMQEEAVRLEREMVKVREKEDEKGLLRSELFYCDHLGVSENDETDIMSFTIDRDEGAGLLLILPIPKRAIWPNTARNLTSKIPMQPHGEHVR